MTCKGYIFVSYSVIGGHTCITVDGLSLYKALGIRIPFVKWIVKRIMYLGFKQGVDYEVTERPHMEALEKFSKYYQSYSNYIMTVDMAKRLCSARNTQKGKKALLYLQGCELQPLDASVHSSPHHSPFAAVRAAACSIQNHLYKAGEASREFGRKSSEYSQLVLQNKKMHPSYCELLGKLDRSNSLTFQALDDLAEGIVRNIEMMRILVEDMM